jgi:uncharacterized membrane protein
MLFALTFVHILFATLWFGGVVFLNAVVIPAAMKLAPAGQKEIGSHLGQQADRFLVPVATLTIIFGVLRGIVAGPITGSTLASSYGITWLCALLVAVWLWWWGTFVIGGIAKRINTASPAEIASLVQRIRLFTMFELLGFAAVFTAMILMGTDVVRP